MCVASTSIGSIAIHTCLCVCGRWPKMIEIVDSSPEVVLSSPPPSPSDSEPEPAPKDKQRKEPQPSFFEPRLDVTVLGLRFCWTQTFFFVDRKHETKMMQKWRRISSMSWARCSRSKLLRRRPSRRTPNFVCSCLDFMYCFLSCRWFCET